MFLKFWVGVQVKRNHAYVQTVVRMTCRSVGEMEDESSSDDIEHLLSSVEAIYDCMAAPDSGALLTAAETGNFVVLKGLLEHGANVNMSDCHGNTALMFAVLSRHLTSVQWLVEHGADLERVRISDGRSALGLAVCNGHFDIARCLLDAGASRSVWLVFAADFGNLDSIQCLLHNATDVNKYEHNGVSPLCAAAGNGNLPIVKCLVMAGAFI